MLRKATVVLFVLASMAACVSCGSNSSHYVYATIPATNQVIVFREDPASGVLTQITGSPYSVGSGASSLVIHPSGKFLYVANPGVNGQNENDISLFNIASNGGLSEVFPRTSVAPSATLPTLLAMDPAGAFLYVANYGGSNNISVFSINSGNGTLTSVAGSPFFIGVTPNSMQLTPKGDFLYVTTTSVNNGLLIGFSLNSGIPTLVSQTSTDDPNPNGLAIDPSGTYIYTANFTAGSLSIFKIVSAGVLQEVQNSPLNVGYAAPISLILDGKGQFLYVADQGSSNVASFSIDASTGLPTALTTSTTTNAFVTESSPDFLVLDPSGKYLFVGNRGSGAGIEVFVVSNGSLTAIGTYAVGNTPTSIAVLSQ